MIKRYLCKNDDLRYYFFLDSFAFLFFGFTMFFLGSFYVSGFSIHLILSFLNFAFCVLFGILTDLQFKKVYKLKKKRSVKKIEKEKECDKK